jgi:hypothetical protein
VEIDIWKKIVPRPLVLFVYSLIFLLALISTAGLTNTFLPYSYTPKNLGDVGIKLQYFTEHKDDYNVIFLGPSSTYFGVIPKLFDELMKTKGESIKSFNFGISGANISQVDFYLKNILALKPAKLKWIFIDCPVDLFDTHFPTSATELYWHTPRKTIENFRLIIESSDNWKIKIIEIFTNFKSFFYRYLGIGQLSNMWQERILDFDLFNSYPSAKIAPKKLIQESGYYAIEWLPNIDKWKQRFLGDNLDTYKKYLKKEQTKSENEQQYSVFNNSEKPYELKMIKKIVSRFDREKYINNNEIEPIFFLPPVLENEVNRYTIVKAYDLGYIPTIFIFNNPNIFANLYQLDRRIDTVHLNQQGAEELTISMADKFSQYLRLSPEKLVPCGVNTHTILKPCEQSNFRSF